MTLHTHSLFDKDTGTWTYVLHDPLTLHAAIIDPVLSFNIHTGALSYAHAHNLIHYVRSQNLSLQWLLETHIHADHLSSSSYLQSELGGKLAISSQIAPVLQYWRPLLDLPPYLDGSQFDLLLDNHASIPLGSLQIQVLHTPGHTPACVSYLIEDQLFVGDTLFHPDIGTARCDFPGGSASLLFHSIHQIYQLPGTVIVHSGHDYPSPDRPVPQHQVSLETHKKENRQIAMTQSLQNYIQARQLRDQSLPPPRLLIPSIQYNLHGRLAHSLTGIRIPFNILEKKS